MKTNIYILLLMVVFSGNNTFAGKVNQSDDFIEKVVLLTDRSIYITGEKIQFQALLIYPDNYLDSLSSSVIYCELITPDGIKHFSGKYLVFENKAYGCMQIPATLFSGVYYIRAYTKLLRNYGPDFYCYKQIRIVNPNKSDFLNVKSNPTVSTNKLTEIKPQGLEPLIAVVKYKPAYSPGDSAKLLVKIDAETETKLIALSLKVIPENADQLVMLEPVNLKKAISNDYFAESSGMSLNGKLTHASSNLPVSDKRVNLSIIGDGRDFMSVSTDSSGRFFFALPDYLGSRDLFICSEKTKSSEMKVWIDNDFCTKLVNLPSPKFSLNKQEKNIVQKMAVNAQINRHFDSEEEKHLKKDVIENSAFYGKPASVLFLDDYIQLPTLEECFNELPSSVKVRKQQGEKYFKMIGNRDLSFYTPLVLVDWVAIDEPERVLAISPNSVSRIEIVNEAYVKGGQTYGGIISIISKRGDFAGIDLPAAGIFVNYKFLDETQCPPDSFIGKPGFPDARNTLIWIPEVHFKGTSNREFSILLPETPMNYSLILQGITKNGEVLTFETIIEEKK